MIRKSVMVVTVLALALSACSKKATDHCKQRTGDGICADAPQANASIANETGVPDVD